MRIKSILLSGYRSFSDFKVDLNNEKNDLHSITSKNGGGKSTLLQLLFISLSSAFNKNNHIYLKEAFNSFKMNKNEDAEKMVLKIILEKDSKIYSIDFLMDHKTNYENIDFSLLDEQERTLSEKDTIVLESTAGAFARRSKRDKINYIREIFKKLEKEYLFSIDDYVFFIKTDLPELLKLTLETKVFLNSPEHQMYLFASNQDNLSLFKSDENNHFKTLKKSNYINELKENIKGLYAYDFLSSELIKKTFNKFFIMDQKSKLTTGKYSDFFDKFQAQFNLVLEDKSFVYELYPEHIQFKTKNKVTLGLNALSHGELRKLSLFFWFKSVISENSIIFLDEIDIGLHPEWQVQIIQELATWCDCQIIIASHSPYIFNHMYYKNIIILNNEENGVKSKKLKTPPINRDLNSISQVIMNATPTVRELSELKNEYKKLLKDEEKNKDEIKEIKRKILEFENKDSNFFQEIELIKELSL